MQRAAGSFVDSLGDFEAVERLLIQQDRMASSALPRAIWCRMRLVMMNIGILYSGVFVKITLVAWF